ncbi:peptidase M23 [Microbacterium sp. Root166]|uniref:M23 family metallopeptidase n=1 Tax=Microbacterium sp. Root166 TaxID=1736478 RepID=UPI0006FD940D|nr:M23 family metallopeptidase [Microbacterium sp. Root166]KQZ83243.1 peptidase M23 [Microbacterium sp. Root166]
MAEQIDSLASEPENDATSPTRRTRARKTVERRPKVAAPAVVKTTRPAASASPKRPNRIAKPLRSLVILSMVGGLVATVALPAFAAGRTAEETVTLQQMAVDDAQSLVVASDATATQITRESYSATTAEEIEKKKAAEAAAERARQFARTASASSVGTNIQLTSPGTGEVRWPILNFTKGRGLGDSGYHQGVDLLAPGGTPLYAAAAGVVKISQESYGGYGVAVTIDHVIGGQRVNTLYGHMTYGSRQVVAGQTVEAGQLIGFVGSTGSSTANHLHFEVHINGSVVDPWAWLQMNAG